MRSKLALLIVLFLLTACTMPVPASQQPPVARTSAPLLTVTSLNLITLESFPVQVHALVAGVLADNCVVFGEPTVERRDNLFLITFAPSRTGGTDCAPAGVPFEKVVPLDVYGLPAGEYLVDAQGVQAAFSLSVDNLLPTEATTPSPGEPTSLPSTPEQPQATPTQPGAAFQGSVQGVVWHDLCAVADGEGGEPAQPSEGCVSLPGGGYTANGVREEGEPGLEGVRVVLSSGACPGSPVAETLTNAQGVYRFDGLSAGDYCVSVDPLDDVNEPLLIPGGWTTPPDGMQAVRLGVAQPSATVDFGWDYQFLPAPQTCTDRAEFVEETVPDGAIFQAGDSFTKTWTLRNVGTCVWTTDYALIFEEGEQMGGDSPQPLSQEVRPGEEVTLSVMLTAPDTPGSYRGDWMLRNASGQAFGLGEQADVAFWVEIHVVATSGGLNLGEPTGVDTFENAARWFMVDTASTHFEPVEGGLRMTSLVTGGDDIWGLSSYGPLSDLYLEAVFRIGDSCAGLDRYGVIVRAPDPSGGYVFGFSCDGRFRLYSWDGETYQSLQPWTNNDAIRVGAGQTNRMGIWLRGNQIKLYANDQLLAEVTDDRFAQGYFGLFISAAETAGFQVTVEKVSYWELAP